MTDCSNNNKNSQENIAVYIFFQLGENFDHLLHLICLDAGLGILIVVRHFIPCTNLVFFKL